MDRFRVGQSSVFDRLELPYHSSMDFQKDRFPQSSSVQGQISQDHSHNEFFLKFPYLNLKGTKPMDLDKADSELMGCPLCAKPGSRFHPCQD
jgi:hypothetical protein